MEEHRVTFVFSNEDGESLEAAKEPLLHNPVFQAMLGGTFQEARTGLVEIPNIKRKLFSLVIEAAGEQGASGVNAAPSSKSMPNPLAQLTLDEILDLMEALQQYSLHTSSVWEMGVQRLKDIFYRLEHWRGGQPGTKRLALSILPKLDPLGLSYSLVCESWRVYMKLLMKAAKREKMHDILRGMLLEPRTEIPSAVEKLLELAIRNQNRFGVKVITSLLAQGKISTLTTPSTYNKPLPQAGPLQLYLLHRSTQYNTTSHSPYTSFNTTTSPSPQQQHPTTTSPAFPYRKYITLACLLGVGWPVLKPLVKANGDTFPLSEREAVFALRKDGTLLAKVARKYSMWHHCLVYGHIEFLPILKALDPEELQRAVRSVVSASAGVDRMRLADQFLDLQREEDLINERISKNRIFAGETLLMIAARKGYQMVCEWLLEQTDVDINQVRQQGGGGMTRRGGCGGTTALHCAVRKGHWDIVEVLLEHGALADGWDDNNMMATELIPRNNKPTSASFAQQPQPQPQPQQHHHPISSLDLSSQRKIHQARLHEAILGSSTFSSPFASALLADLQRNGLGNREGV